MKDSILTIRLPSATRRQVEQFAEREARSLSQATERLIVLGLAAARAGAGATGEPQAAWGSAPEPLAGSLAGGLVPTLDDFRGARHAVSAALDARTRGDAKPRR